MTKQEITEGLIKLEQVLSFEISRDNPDEVIGKLEELQMAFPLSANLISATEREYNLKLMKLVQNDGKNLSATDKKILFAGLACEEIADYTKAERMNKAISYSIDSLRSILSFLKSEIKNG